VWVSFDDGAHWQPLTRNLPPVPVHDLAVAQGDLVAATHGRGFWILDDLSALRQLTPQVASASTHLFKPRDVTRSISGGPSSRAAVYYALAQPNQTVTLEFLDAKGNVIRTFSSALDSAGRADSVRNAQARRARAAGDSARAAGEEPAPGGEEEDEDRPRRPAMPTRVPNKVGLNTFVWDLRYPDASTFPNLIMWAGSTRGPQAAPGTYAVRMTVNGQPQTQPFAIRKDPRVTATQQDLDEQFALLIRIRDKLSAANDAVKSIRAVKQQIAERKAKAPKSFATQADQLVKRLSAIEEEIYQVRNRSSQDPLNYPIKLNNKIAALSGVVASADARPTKQSYEVFDMLSAQLDTQLAALKRELETGLPKLNAMLKGVGEKEIVGGE
jgi:hypothetical protein